MHMVTIVTRVTCGALRACWAESRTTIAKSQHHVVESAHTCTDTCAITYFCTQSSILRAQVCPLYVQHDKRRTLYGTENSLHVGVHLFFSRRLGWTLGQSERVINFHNNFVFDKRLKGFLPPQSYIRKCSESLLTFLRRRCS